MKFLRNTLDKVEPLFHKGGKLEKLYPAYEAADTFLYTPGHKTASGPHIRDGIDLKRMMIMVVIALIPATLFGMWNVGFQHYRATVDWNAAPLDPNILSMLFYGALKFLPVYAVTIAVGGTIEAIFSIIRKHEINEGFLVTSLLFPLTLPPDIPLWQVGIGIAFGVIIGKEIFGGTGMNILNPALTARIFLYFAYPVEISGDRVWISGAGVPAGTEGAWIDGATGATPLGYFASNGAATDAMAQANELGISWFDAFMGWIPGSMGETSTAMCLIGAAVLIFSKVGSWRIMLSCGLGMVLFTLLLNAFAPAAEAGAASHYMTLPPHWHFVIGSFAFGSIFMATDPVSAAQTNTGRWIYGFMVGALTVLVRVLNPAYPAGIMLAIIFMNVFAPLIDHYVMKANIRRREVRLGLQ
ncbi:Na(+)-translocating NADH-quinone reductase subunit B [Planctomycetes bacterium Poly30]|uniref:Na(+)-translocating NADH-quinone reductase subunit B n=1 Tax=Saltatorellus ferox TaxID=2528018 RepID=A0A518EWT0_9BACT|nr:Na(+)-translocating NADH-quinone reductase subunit B [Planctomycetes bacterium Poly30]